MIANIYSTHWKRKLCKVSNTGAAFHCAIYENSDTSTMRLKHSFCHSNVTKYIKINQEFFVKLRRIMQHFIDFCGLRITLLHISNGTHFTQPFYRWFFVFVLLHIWVSIHLNTIFYFRWNVASSPFCAVELFVCVCVRFFWFTWSNSIRIYALHYSLIQYAFHK